jgi:hypothetical protein
MTIESGPVTAGQIAELTGLTSGSASRLIDRPGHSGAFGWVRPRS